LVAAAQFIRENSNKDERVAAYPGPLLAHFSERQTLVPPDTKNEERWLAWMKKKNIKVLVLDDVSGQSASLKEFVKRNSSKFTLLASFSWGFTTVWSVK